MFLNITNTGTPINQELADYLNANIADVGYNQIYIVSSTLDKNKETNIVYPGFDNTLPNTICISEENLNENIIDWLKSI